MMTDNQKSQYANECGVGTGPEKTSGFDVQVFAKELAEAVDYELRGIRSRLAEMEVTVGKFRRMFESAFEEEAKVRLGLDGNKSGGELRGCMVSPISQLVNKLGRM